ncbi:hypothetical protein [Nocardiopsis changdeensis]|uniref:hypothetical protein n=1 Tax=Nocardiopsis changdeensis TaxID=2831969 RepID=UPI003F4640B8
MVTGLVTTAFIVLMTSISVQLRNTLKTARTTRQSNYLTALNSPTEKNKALDRIDDLKRKPEELAAEQRELLDKQVIAVNTILQRADEIQRAVEKKNQTVGTLERAGALDIVFSLTDAGLRSDVSTGGALQAAVDERNRKKETGQDTSQDDLALREQGRAGLVTEHYVARADAPLSAEDKVRLDRYVREQNHLNSPLNDILRDALENRPASIARAGARHGLTDPNRRGVAPPQYFGPHSRLGPAQGVVAALQRGGASRPATDPANIPRLPVTNTTARNTGQSPSSGRSSTP